MTETEQTPDYGDFSRTFFKVALGIKRVAEAQEKLPPDHPEKWDAHGLDALKASFSAATHFSLRIILNPSSEPHLKALFGGEAFPKSLTLMNGLQIMRTAFDCEDGWALQHARAQGIPPSELPTREEIWSVRETVLGLARQGSREDLSAPACQI